MREGEFHIGRYCAAGVYGHNGVVLGLNNWELGAGNMTTLSTTTWNYNNIPKGKSESTTGLDTATSGRETGSQEVMHILDLLLGALEDSDKLISQYTLYRMETGRIEHACFLNKMFSRYIMVGETMNSGGWRVLVCLG